MTKDELITNVIKSCKDPNLSKRLTGDVLDAVFENISKAVKKVDAARYRFIRSLFVEMGFAGKDLECRVRAWLVYSSASRSVNFPRVEPECKPDIDTLLDFFTGKKAVK